MHTVWHRSRKHASTKCLWTEGIHGVIQPHSRAPIFSMRLQSIPSRSMESSNLILLREPSPVVDLRSISQQSGRLRLFPRCLCSGGC